jgi:PKHD-type hydroxylase
VPTARLVTDTAGRYYLPTDSGKAIAMILIESFLGEAQLNDIRQALSKVAFIPGQFSGGIGGASIKNNLQANPKDPAYPQASGLVIQALFSSPAIQAYARPNHLTPINFARYGAGMAYGDHVDAAVHVLTNMVVRTDISFTVFLSGPDDYDGGELVVNVAGAERVVKPNAGDIFVYPTGVTHRVNPVRSGWRNVAVGWMQSMVANHEHREILYKLETARDQLLKTARQTPAYELVNSVHENLLRLFVQP